ncbi:A1 family peptidase [Phanerochaete sordida]|uniref:A1 family peptidase n=1 Tax=Phanerochaete sordida TaxID=48140 RepID=A0A9P3LCU6_9APHY|nr:A1 family peptidase [Phanerochaete sordida]
MWRYLGIFSLILASSVFRTAACQSIPLFRVPKQQPASPPSLFSSNVSVSDVNGFAYLARMDIGAQNFLVLLDTGSSDLWIVSSGCTEDDCSNVPKYQPTPTLDLSPTAFELRYLLGEVSGVIGTETVGLGRFEVLSQVFALANQTAGLGLAATGNSGILGLSFPTEAAIPDTSGRTLLENLVSSLAEPDRYFAVRLGRDSGGSSFTVGELDPAYSDSLSDFAFSDVYSAGHAAYDYWKVPLHAITVNGTSFDVSDSRVPRAPSPIAIFDTGTTLILGPSADVDRLWQSIGGARKTDSGWQVRCDRAMVIGMVLGAGDGAKEYAIDPADLSWLEGGRDGDWCMGGIQSNDDVSSGDWLLGDTFLRNVYIVHHLGNSTQHPMVGLNGLTDPQTSLANFRLARGNDPTPPAPVLGKVTHHRYAISEGAICGISAAGGFVFGGVLTVVISACVARRAAKY